MSNQSLIIICCRASKAKAPSRADEMYGTVFKAQRNYVRHFYDDFKVLSAKYGLIDPDKIIAPYDVSFFKPGHIDLSIIKETILGINPKEIILFGPIPYIDIIRKCYDGPIVNEFTKLINKHGRDMGTSNQKKVLDWSVNNDIRVIDIDPNNAPINTKRSDEYIISFIRNNPGTKSKTHQLLYKEGSACASGRFSRLYNKTKENLKIPLKFI